MSRSQRHLHWLQATLLGLLALCLVLQPVLAAAGEFHESFAHADQAALHLEGAGDHAADEDAAGGEPSSALHVLLHFAHCCGHPAGLNPPELGAQWVALPEYRPLTTLAAPVLVTRVGTPFRPPIQA